jgi:hypothetical protein
MTDVATLVRRATDAHARLARRAEAVEDEWQYIADLETVWSARLGQVASARARESVTQGTEAAVEALVAEVEQVVDPHRAIDWLSTFPAVVLLALGESA